MLISTCVGVYTFTVSSFHLGQALMEAVAMYDYDAAEDNELTFKKGQIIMEVIALDDSWSEGRLLHNGQYGMFPSNYVEMRRAAPIEHLPSPVGEFSMLSTVDMCAACSAVPVDSTGAVEDKQCTFEFLLTCCFTPCMLRLSCVGCVCVCVCVCVHVYSSFPEQIPTVTVTSFHSSLRAMPL